MDQLEGFEDQLFILIDDDSSIREIKNLENEIFNFANRNPIYKQNQNYRQLLQLIKKHKQTYSILSEYKPYLYIAICVIMDCCLHFVNYESYKSSFILTFFLSIIFVLLLNESLIEFKNSKSLYKPVSITKLITNVPVCGTCCICLDDLNANKQTKKVVTKCGHHFHYKCLRSWIYNDNVCPICRASII